MADGGEQIDEGDEIERRIASARSAIDKSLQELVARSEQAAGVPPGEAGAAGGVPPPVIEAPSRPVAPPGADPAERRAVDSVAAEFERRSAALEERIGAMIADGERRIAARLTAVVAEAEARLAAVEDAQAREERIRERTAAAEREAEKRVREAERRLVEVLDRVAAAERRRA
jgi:hypothetical protein